MSPRDTLPPADPLEDRSASSSQTVADLLSLEALIGIVDAELGAVEQRPSVPRDEPREATSLMLRFSAGDHVFAVPIEQMIEIEAVPVLTFVPQMAPVVRGLANLRGEIMVVLDLGRYLGLDQDLHIEATERRMIVVRDGCLGRPTGVLVDRVFGIGSVKSSVKDTVKNTVLSDEIETDSDSGFDAASGFDVASDLGSVAAQVMPFVQSSARFEGSVTAQQLVAVIDLQAFSRSVEAETAWPAA